MTARGRSWLLFAVSALTAAVGCSDTLTLGKPGTACDDDKQCAAPLACKCVRRRSPDDEGPDEILAHGHCEVVTYKCVSDAGADTGGSGSDTGAEAPDADASDAKDAAETGDAPAETPDAPETGDADDAADGG